MPEDIHSILWSRVAKLIVMGKFAVTKEIYDEMCHIPGEIGECIKANCATLQLEVGDDGWPWIDYLGHVNKLTVAYSAVISEYNGNRKATVGLNDISIIALAKALGLPVVSMEAVGFQPSQTRMRIPQVCKLEGVPHLDFNQLLRAEGIKN